MGGERDRRRLLHLRHIGSAVVEQKRLLLNKDDPALGTGSNRCIIIEQQGRLGRLSSRDDRTRDENAALCAGQRKQ